MIDTTSALHKAIEAHQLNDAVYELFLNIGNGDVSADHLAEMTNKAIELNRASFETLQAVLKETPAALQELADYYKDAVFICPENNAAKLLHKITKPIGENDG